MNIFEHKEFVLLFAVLAVLSLFYFLLLKWKKQVKKQMGDEKLIDALISSWSSGSTHLKFLIVLIALASGIIAAMNPRKPGESLVKRNGIDLAIALDVSKSMLAADMAPSRLERAKQFITRLMSSMPDDRVALVLFAGKAYLQMPLTVDHAAAQLFVNSATPNAVPQQGTVISDALEKSAYAISGTGSKFKTIVLISDGEDHEEDAVSMAKQLASQGVMINSIGIGSTEGSTIIDPQTGELKKDDSGNPVISKLNEETLKEIATATNGVYTRLESSESAIELLSKQFSQIDRKAYADYSQVNFKTYYPGFVALMFVLLVVEIFISEVKRKTPVSKTRPV